jgi:hypothetical protein
MPEKPTTTITARATTTIWPGTIGSVVPVVLVAITNSLPPPASNAYDVPDRLSITHKFTAESIAEGEVGETGETAPHDDIAWHGITGAGQVAAEPSNPDQIGAQERTRPGFPFRREELIEQIQLKLREGNRRCGLGLGAIDHGHPENTPTEPASCS